MTLVPLPKNFAKLSVLPDFDWSYEQEFIFDWFESGEGNAVVRARAGTGKTTTILEGVNRAPERRILLTAFNKSIAEELQGRVRNSNVRAQTLHSLGLAFCRRNIPGLQIDTKGERARVLAKAACAAKATRAGLKKSGASFEVLNAVGGLCTKIRETFGDPMGAFIAAQHVAMSDEERARAFNTFWSRMEAFAVSLGYEGAEPGYWNLSNIVEAACMAVDLAKADTTVLDFADMIFLPLARNWTNPVCDLLVVDEAQDMSEAQLQLAIGATRKDGRVCIVGDDRQAIYAFRGADSGSLDRLKVELSATEFGLKTTYRCPKTVVALAKKFVPDFEVAPEAPEGCVVSLKSYEQLVKAAEPGDFVLSRVNAPLAGVCLELIRAGKRAFVKGADLGKGLLNLLEKIGDDCTTLKELSTALGAWRKAALKKATKLEAAAQLEKRAQIEDKFELLSAFIEGAGERALKGLDDLRTHIEATFAEAADKDAIMCSSVHRAKGLEARQVFLLGRTFSRDSDEEDNICYVAATRAKDSLFLVGKTVSGFTAVRSEFEAMLEACDVADVFDFKEY